MEILISPSGRSFLSTVFAVDGVSCLNSSMKVFSRKFSKLLAMATFVRRVWLSRNRWFVESSQTPGSRIFTRKVILPEKPAKLNSQSVPSCNREAPASLQNFIHSDAVFGECKQSSRRRYVKTRIDWWCSYRMSVSMGWQKRRASHKFPCELVCLASSLPFFCVI